MKKNQEDIKVNLTTKHQEILTELNNENNSYEEIMNELNKLENEYNNFVIKDYNDIIKRNQLNDKILILKQRIDKIKQNKKNYFVKNADLIFNYNNNDLIYKPKTPNISKNNKPIYSDKYLQLNDKNYNFKNINNCNYLCLVCNVSKILKKNESKIVCPNCGEINDIIIEGEKPSMNDPPPEPHNYKYVKYSHFCKWLSKIQGLDNCDIPEEVYTNIKKELKLERITDYSTITEKQIKRYLNKYKNLGYAKYNDNIVQIYINLLCGNINTKNAPISLTLKQETEFKYLFLLIQEPYNLFKKEDENFRSYSLLIYKFAELYGYTDICNKLKLLKDKQKINKFDIQWKQILEYLGGKKKGFEFIPTY
jgi:predicted RNA-binding Zn-ribbon protein involved in translation (DUF1610 family)